MSVLQGAIMLASLAKWKRPRCPTVFLQKVVIPRPWVLQFGPGEQSFPVLITMRSMKQVYRVRPMFFLLKEEMLSTALAQQSFREMSSVIAMKVAMPDIRSLFRLVVYMRKDRPLYLTVAHPVVRHLLAVVPIMAISMKLADLLDMFSP